MSNENYIQQINENDPNFEAFKQIVLKDVRNESSEEEKQYLSENLDDPNDFIITYNSNQVYLKPVGYQANPWPVLQNYRPYLRSAGYFRSDEVYTTIKSLDNILLADPATFQPNVSIAVTFEGTGWNVYKYTNAGVSVTNVDYSNSAKTLTITLTLLSYRVSLKALLKRKLVRLLHQSESTNYFSLLMI